MRIGFDAGGVLSKYPEKFKELIYRFRPYEVFVITDMHPLEEVLEVLALNKFIYKAEDGEYYDDFISVSNIKVADYNKYGEMCKAVLIKELTLDIYVDDHEPYLRWDSTFGPQPILLKVVGDPYKPYWSETWQCNGGNFGRRCFTKME